MPNFLGALGSGLATIGKGVIQPFYSGMPTRVRPEDLASDMNGITGQPLQVTPDMIQAVQDPTIRSIAADALTPPPLPTKQPSAWRTLAAGLLNNTAAYGLAPRVLYGSKGLQQMQNYERWQDQLPRRLDVARLLTNQKNAESQDDATKENRALREQTQQTNADQDFIQHGGQILPPPAPVSIGRSRASELPAPIDANSISDLPTINQTPSRDVSFTPPQLPTPNGYFDVAARAWDQPGTKRIQATAAEVERQKKAAAQEVSQADWQVVTPQMAQKLPELGLTAGTKVPPAVFNNLVDAATVKAQNPDVVIATDERTGTMRGLNRITGQEMWKSAPGVDMKRPPAAQTVISPGGMTKEQATLTNQLTREFMQQPAAKNFNEIQNMNRAIQDAAQDKSGVSDITLLRMFARLTDPNTGVREEEYRTMSGAQSLVDQAQTLIPKVMNGERLTPETRKRFADMATRLMGNRSKDYQKLKDFYTNKSKTMGVDPSLVILDLQDQSASSGIPKISSDAEYNALPKGSQYMDPQGNVRTKN